MTICIFSYNGKVNVGFGTDRELIPDSDLLANMPSAEAIAEQIRHRSAGAVIVDICRDLGIDTTHPLWPAIRDAIIGHNGSLARMVTFWIDRLRVLLRPSPAPAGATGTTGPS